MKTKFNYTGRKRILRSGVVIGIRRPNQLPEAVVESLDLSRLSLPSDAAVFLEIDTGRVGLARHSLGTVGELDLSPGFPLSEMDLSDVSFRIKVAGRQGDSRGKLLADVDHLRQQDQGHVSSLLEVRPSDDLGQRIWKLDITPEGPQLLINAGLPDWRDYGNSRGFQVLVFPQAVYQICYWLRKFDDYEEGTVEGRWRNLFKNAGHDPAPRDRPEDLGHDDFDSEWDDWAQEVADSFARKHRTLETLIGSLEEGNA